MAMATEVRAEEVSGGPWGGGQWAQEWTVATAAVRAKEGSGEPWGGGRWLQELRRVTVGHGKEGGGGGFLGGWNRARVAWEVEEEMGKKKGILVFSRLN